MKNSQDQAFLIFGELAKLHSIKANTVNKDSFQEKQTNIIFELIQNADNAQATNATFELYNDKLIFRHDGKRHFTISDPTTEDDDYTNGKLGDINSITSTFNFNQQNTKIGKIGIGFKAVFQYTITPMIYDTNYCFQINQYIIPGLLNNDYPGRKPDETIFVFPFNNPEKNASSCFSDISEKLNNLQHPILFLKTLTHLNFFILEKKNLVTIERKNEISLNFNDVKAELINVTSQNLSKRFWIFSRQVSTIHNISVSFCINNDGFLIPTDGEVNCLLPLKIRSHLKFIVNAPFLLDNDYVKIKENESHNETMMTGLANLAAKSIVLFKDIGEKYNIRLINDNILQIIPIDYLEFSSVNYISIKPFYNAIQKVFLTEKIIPTIDGYSSHENAFWSPDQSLIELFSQEQFQSLVNNDKAKLVFTTIKMNKDDQKSNNSLKSYIQKIINSMISESTVFTHQSSEKPSNSSTNFTAKWGSSSSSSSNTNSGWLKGYNSTGWTNSSTNSTGWTHSSTNSTGWTHSSTNPSFKGITKEFIEKQSFEWLHKFYKWISEDDERIKKSKFSPIFINSSGKAVPAFNPNNNNLQLFFPYESSQETINPKLIENENTFLFLKKVGLTVPNLKNEILNQIIPKYQNQGYISTLPDFKKIFFFYKYCSYEESNELIKKIKDVNFILYFTRENSKIDRDKASNLYIPSNFLFEYFEHLPQKKYIAIDQYIELIDKKDKELLINFFIKLGATKNVKIVQIGFNEDMVKKFDLPYPYYTQYIHWNEYRIEEFDYVWNLVQKDPKKSIVLWNVLSNLLKSTDPKLLSFGCCRYFYYTEHRVNFPSIFRSSLINTKWLLTERNELVAPSEVFLKELPKQFHPVDDDDEIAPICRFLDVKKRNVELLTQEFIDDHDFVQRLINAGLLQKVKKDLEDKESKAKKTQK